MIRHINCLYVWLTLFTLILILAFLSYSYGDLSSHIDNYVNMYINLRNK